MEQQMVTIFVSVYNIGEYLERFFECLEKQTFRNYKLLLIDDGSTDNSLSICRAHAEKDSRIKVVPIEHCGISAARNLLHGMLDTEFAVSLDGDDYFGPDYLKHLMDAQKKYDADFVISNVIYVTEEGRELSRFSPRKEELFTKDQIPNILPELLIEKRLNYVYTKLFRTDYLKDIHVEPDVNLGSDTMINIQYVTRINNIAVIEDYDYYYVQYPSRSVTSVKSTDFFWRMCRIQKFLYDTTKENGLLNDKMLHAIDYRTMVAGVVGLNRIACLDIKLKEQLAAAHKVIYSDEYLCSYNRLKKKGQLETLNFEVIHPDEEEAYIKRMRNRRRKDRILKYTPKFIFKTYHRIKKELGLVVNTILFKNKV